MMLLILFSFFVFFFECSSSGIIETGENQISDLKGFLSKYYEIRESDRTLYLGVSIYANTSSEISNSIYQGDILQFFISRETSYIGKEISEPVTDKTVWRDIRCLTNNEESSYDGVISNMNDGESTRETEYEHTIKTNGFQMEANRTYKLQVVGYLCSDYSNCGFEITLEQKNKPWMWIILGSLVGCIFILCFIGFWIWLFGQTIWFWGITRTPKEWLKASIVFCDQNEEMNYLLTSWLDEANDGTLLKFLQWITELKNIRFNNGQLERNGKEIRIFLRCDDDLLSFQQQKSSSSSFMKHNNEQKEQKEQKGEEIEMDLISEININDVHVEEIQKKVEKEQQQQHSEEEEELSEAEDQDFLIHQDPIYFCVNRREEFFELWIRKTLPENVRNGIWDFQFFSMQLEIILNDKKKVGSFAKRWIYRAKTGIRYYFAKGQSEGKV